MSRPVARPTQANRAMSNKEAATFRRRPPASQVRACLLLTLLDGLDHGRGWPADRDLDGDEPASAGIPSDFRRFRHGKLLMAVGGRSRRSGFDTTSPRRSGFCGAPMAAWACLDRFWRRGQIHALASEAPSRVWPLRGSN